MFFKEKLHKALEMAFGGGFILRYFEKAHSPHGQYHIILRDSIGKIIEERSNHNIIVNSASILIARLLKDNQDPTGGITFLAVGTGGPSWNLQNPPQPTNIQTTLVSEIARKAFSTIDVTFIDPETGNPTTVPTNVLDFTATFAETEAVGALVEMGLFGGDATNIVNSGTEINYVTFPVINKTNAMTLTIIFRITC
jgi:hypothetical protein